MSAAQSEAWIAGAIREKNATGADASLVGEVLGASLATMYKAVAFDIDGTLTEPGSARMDPRLCQLVARLLRRGCHVWLVTGRGSSGATSVVGDILKHTNLDADECLRLKCVTHNGGVVQEIDPVKPGAWFTLRQQLLEPFAHAAVLGPAVSDALKANGLVPKTQTMEPEGPGALGLRVVFGDVDTRDRAVPVLETVAASYPELTLRTGLYANLSTIDISTADKAEAVEVLAQRHGIDPAYVLRVGDQGHEGGNDESFLATPTGFSVGTVSASSTGCFPVVKDGRTLGGADATLHLFDALWIGAPLRKEIAEGQHRDELLPRLREFERSAMQRSSVETQMIERQLSVRIAQLINHDPGAGTFDVTVGDLFDRSSGGVRIHEWDLPELEAFPAVNALFEFSRLDRKSVEEDGPSRCMYTDSAVLLRGPDYYMNLTLRKRATELPNYLSSVETFVDKALLALEEISEVRPTEPLVRIAMAICDNVRDILLQLLNVALFNAQPPTDTCTDADDRFVTEIGSMAASHTCSYVDFLLEPHRPWTVTVAETKKPIHALREWLTANSAEFAKRTATQSSAPAWLAANKKDAFRWREADDIVQNISAVVMGLRAVAGRPTEGARRFLAVGLQYGGLELPLLAAALGPRFGLEFVPAAMRVSMYSDADTKDDEVDAKKDLDGWIRRANDDDFPVAIIAGANENDAPRDVMLFDDNCTTGRTVQASRDMLVRRGHDVHAVVVVRFPGANRAAHMGLAGHGYLDIDLAHNFVHGLVGPSPYARLVVPHPGTDQYQDENGVFDKAKLRIQLLLHKNCPNRFQPPSLEPWGNAKNA